MEKEAYAVKLDRSLLRDVKEFCDQKGYKQSAFVEQALREKMERDELKDDIFDLVSLRSQEIMARPFTEYDRTRK